MLKKNQKIVFKYLKNMKTCAPTGATVIGCKCYWVQLVLGATVFHPRNSRKTSQPMQIPACSIEFLSTLPHPHP